VLALRSLLVLVVLSLCSVALAGCELIASFDRDEIPLPGTGVPSIPDDMDAGDPDAGLPPPPEDGGPTDAGMDAGRDGGALDAAVDAGPDGGPDAGSDAGPDAGADAGPADAGSDAATDAGSDAG
jgi:hypothetical protein